MKNTSFEVNRNVPRNPDVSCFSVLPSMKSLFFCICYITPSFSRYLHSFFRPHAEEEAYPVEVPDKTRVEGHDDDEETDGNDQILWQHTDVPAYDKPAD